MTNNTPHTYYIIGPTAIGKSNYAIDLAKKINGEIISADAYQIYKYMNIGTGKTPIKHQQKIPHHLLDILTPDQNYNVTDFLKRTNTLINSITKKNKTAIICGGNGLYLQSFLYNYTFPAAKSDPEIRKNLEEKYISKGKEYLWNYLNKTDPVSAKKIHPNNKHHLLRCIEIYEITKKIPSEIKQKSPTIRPNTKIIGLNSSRNVVKDLISTRVDNMIKIGLIEEVNLLLKKGYPHSLPALNCIGYKEVISYLKGIIDKKDMIELIKRNSYHFSKRQLTWFKKIENINWL
jgi:tRNA dimethylallyltransferase